MLSVVAVPAVLVVKRLSRMSFYSCEELEG
jgi:hypothetical protein